MNAISMPYVDDEILILDAHGVIFNNPWSSFLTGLADATSQSAEQVLDRWRHELRSPSWTGEIEDDEIWRRLSCGQGDPECWQALLETYYGPGPVAPMLESWSRQMPIWILSNHRTRWLLRRLKRFGLDPYFDRIIVSEDVRLLKPDIRLFQDVADQLRQSKRVFYIDDQARNIEAASSVGFHAMHVDCLERLAPVSVSV